MKISTSRLFLRFLILALFILQSSIVFGQRTYGSSQNNGVGGLLCLACGVQNPGNAADGNTQTYATLNVSVGLLASAYEEIVFPSKPAAGTPVSVKLGTGDNLLSITALGGVRLQAYNGSATVGPAMLASDLVSVLANNNQLLVTYTPSTTQQYDRIRVTLDGGLVGALSSFYVYEAFFNGPASVACNSAVDELHGISSGLLSLGLSTGGVVNPELAIDGNLNTASTLNAGIGAVGAYAQQTILFAKQSVQGDSVRVTVSFPASLLTLGVLDNVTLVSYNGNTSNNDAHTFNDGLLHLRLLDGSSNKYTITYAPSAVFDRVQVRLGGGIAAVLSSMNLYEAQLVIPKPVVKYNTVATNNVSTCAGSTVTLNVDNIPNTTINWYTAQTGGTAVATGNSFTTPALAAGTTTYYVEAQRTGCTDASDRQAVTITVYSVPGAPVVPNSTVTVCTGQTATFTATSTPGITINWYAAATGGTPVATGNTFTTTALTANATYYAEAVAGGICVSPTRTQVTANVSALPTAPTIATPNVTICDGDVAVFAIGTPDANLTYNWYTTATGGTPVYTGVNYTTGALHSNATYYVEAVNNNGCASSARTQATVTVQLKPADPILLAGSTNINAGQTTNITVTNAQTGITYNWYASSTAATPIFTGTTFTTPALVAPTTYYVSAVNSTGCTSTNRTAITINVTINTNSPCSFANNETHSVGGVACVLCAINNPALAVDADTTTASTLRVTVGLAAYAQQEVVFQNPGFAGDTVKLSLQAPVGLADATVLGGVTVTFYNGTTAGASYTLNNALIKLNLLGGNKFIALVRANAAYDRVVIRLDPLVTALTSLNIFYVAQVFPTPVFNPVAPEVCKGSSATINITSPSNGTLTWYDAATGGTLVNTGASFTTPALNANTTYYIVYTRNGCTNGVRYPLTIVVDDVPVKPTAALSNVTIYAGQTATLTASAPTGATVKWYDAATGGTLVGTGSSFITPVLNANKTYYAESSLGNCVSVDRTPVSVTVLPVVIPDVTVVPPTQTINAGETTSFTASSTTPGAVFTWYTTPTGGTPIFTGANFTTPAQFSNTTYYAEATIPATGAKSATRAPAAVVVNNTANNPVPCGAAIDQTVASSGILCVACGVGNATGSVDADRNTFAQLNVPVGLGLAQYEQQTLRFASTGRAGDSIVVELGVPASLLDLTLLSNISLATYNGSTYNNDRFAVNPSLLTLNLLSGVNRFRVAFKATADFDRVEIRLNSVLSAFNALNIYDAYQEVAAPTVTASAVTACAGTQATLTATAPDYVTVKWYSSATGGSPLFTGKVYTTAALAAGTYTFYAEASRTADGCAQTVRTPVTVTVTDTPANPVVSVPTVTICSGQTATFAATPVTGVTFNWYTAATGGTPVGTGNSFTSPALTANTVYYVEASNGSCTSSARTQVTANVTTAVANPTIAQTSVQTCSGSTATLTASSTQPGVTFKWYTAATGGTAVFTGATFTTPTLTANTTYYVEAGTGTCTSASRASATVTVNPTPVAPTVTVVPAGQQITSGQTATMTASSTTPGATFNWYSSATGGTPIATGATFTTPALTATTTYYVESALATGCTSTTRTPVTITVNPIYTTSCDFANTQTNGLVGLACALCGVDNPNNAIDNNLDNASTIRLGVGVVGGWQQTLIFDSNGSAGDTVTVKIGTSGLIDISVLSAALIQSAKGGTLNADQIALNSNLIKIQLLSGGQTALVKFVPSADYDRITITLNGAVSALSSLDIYYASKQVEAPVLAANSVNICGGGSATFTVSNARPSVVTYDWYDAAVGGTKVHTGTSYTVTGLTATTTYYVQSSRTATGCVNPNRVPATVNVTPAPPTPTLAANTATVCLGDPVTLSVTNAGTSTINWYDAPVGGNLLSTGASYTFTPVVNGSYYAEATNGSCTSSARTLATVTVNQRPSNPGVVSANVQVCTGSTATLQVLNPQSGVVYNWYSVATGGTSLGAGSSFVTPAITANTTFYVGASNAIGGCENTGGRTAVNVTTGGIITPPTLSATTTQVCAGGSATVSVTNPVVGLTYNWYTTPTGGTAVYSGVSYTVNNVTVNAKYYVEAANTSGCVSATRTETDINVQAPPTPPQVQVAAGGTSVCSGSSASLSILNPDVNLVYRWYDAATNGTILYTGTQFNTPALTANTTYYVEAAAAGNCNPSARTQVTITVTPLPNSPALVQSTVLVCQGSPATLQVSNPQSGITYQWYDSPSQTNKLFEGNTYVTGPITANTMFYVAAVNANGCRSNSLGTAQVNVQSAPGAPMLTNNAVSTCANSQATLSINNPQTGFTYNWYSTATGGTALASGTTFTTPVLTANTTYYAEAVNSTGCVSGTRAVANVTVNPAPQNPVVTAVGGSTNPTICSNSTITLNATSATANVTFNWYNVATGGTPIATGASYTTGALTATTTIYAEAVANGTGCVSNARTGITINISAPPSTPVPVAATVNACNGSPATLAVSNPVAGVTYRWYDASKTTVLATGPTYTTGNITANATYYVDATAGSCSSPSLASVQVTVVAIPGAPVLASNTVNNCSGSQATLSVASPQTGYTYNWYAAATGGSPLNSGTSFITPALTANTTYYAEAVNSNGCSSATRTSVSVNVLPVPPTPTLAAGGTDICAGSTTTLAVSNPDAALTYRWFTQATGGTAASTGATFTTPALNANTTYYVEAGNAGGCVSTTRAAVTVQVRQPLAKPVVAVGTATNNSVTFQWVAVPGAVSYQVSLDNGATFAAPSSGASGLSHTVAGLQPNQAVTIVVKAFGSVACQLSALSDAVTGRSLNPFGDGLYIPNAFSPNGDGKNDIFQVYGTNVKSVTIWVYNQWGSLMLQTSNNAAGWDGTYKGTPQPVGVYVYYVEAIMNDSQKVTKKGTVTLLR